MKNSKIRLIALDMDGTLLNGECRIPDANFDAIKEAEENGIRIAIVSGRVPDDISYFMSDVGFENCFVLSLNGGYCLDKPHGSAFYAQYMDKKHVDACIQILESEKVTYSAFGRSHVAISRPFDSGEDLEQWGTNLKRKGNIRYTFGMEGINEQLKLGTNKIVYIDRKDPERLLRVKEKIRQIDGVEVTSSWFNNIEIMPKGVDKGKALKALSEMLHLDAGQVMAIGDNDNDIPMLSFAGWSFAMGNATPGAKAAAKHVTDDNDNAGVAKAIRRFALL